MSVQIFLQGKLLNIQSFLVSPPASAPADGIFVDEEALAVGRSRWVALLSEVVPRALLAELGLARILLGSSGGGQFLVVLPGEAREQAEALLTSVQQDIHRLSCGRLKLVWAATENLGDWSVVRKRLSEAMARRRGAPATDCDEKFFLPSANDGCADSDEYFIEELGRKFVDADSIGWSPEEPARLKLGEGKYLWSLRSTTGDDSLPVARHTAPSDDDAGRATASTLAARAEGRPAWAILRGDVDNLGIRLRRAQSIEEHVQLSVMCKNFFAGELEVLCSLPEFWRKVNILYCGGDDFAVYGAWDALTQLARELRRLFHRFSDENLKEFPGPDGKTLTMALTLAERPESSFTAVYQQAGEQLEAAKCADKDCFSVLGRTLEWKQVAEASELKDALARMVREFGCPRQFLLELASLTRPETTTQGRGGRFDRPWRLTRRLNRVSGGVREREFQKLRAHVAAQMLGKSAAHLKLRPAGSVAVGWARLLTEV